MNPTLLAWNQLEALEQDTVESQFVFRNKNVFSAQLFQMSKAQEFPIAVGFVILSIDGSLQFLLFAK